MQTMINLCNIYLCGKKIPTAYRVNYLSSLLRPQNNEKWSYIFQHDVILLHSIKRQPSFWLFVHTMLELIWIQWSNSSCIFDATWNLHHTQPMPIFLFVDNNHLTLSHIMYTPPLIHQVMVSSRIILTNTVRSWKLFYVGLRRLVGNKFKVYLRAFCNKCSCLLSSILMHLMI